MTSSTRSGTSTIICNLVLNFDPDKAITEITAKINSVINQLPQGVQQPTLTVAIGQSLDALIIGFASDDLSPNQVTDYLVRNVQPRLQSVPGVQTAELLGQQNFALRAWLDPAKLAAYGLTASDVSAALSSNNVIAGVGTTKGQMVQFNLTASTNLHSVQAFRDLVVKQVNGGIIRLSDVANVTLGADDYESGVSYNGKKGVYIGIQTVPSASLLSVIAGVKAVLPSIQQQLPAGLAGDVIYDSTVFVNSSINEVERSLGETVLIVTLVVFAFLGSPRSVIIPVVTIPLSLIGTFAAMVAFGFSINLLTLLALVLAIGLVVDDAIIVVESVNRHLEEGMRPRDAAIKAGRDLANPIIAMTVVLIAVYVPIGFQSGLTGALFTEFAFTVVGAVTMSAIVALTLSPMMCGFLLRPHAQGAARGWADRLSNFIDRILGRLQRGYERGLRGSLRTRSVALTFAVLVIGGIYFLYNSADSELAPQEDQGVVILLPTSAPDATLQQKLLFSEQVQKIMSALPEADQSFQVESPVQSISGVTLKPWEQRHRDANAIQRQLQGQLSAVAGQRVVAFLPPALPGAQGLPIQFVLKSTQPLATLYPEAQKFLADATASGMFLFIDSDLKIDAPQLVIEIDRDKAAQLGLSMTQVGGALGSLLGGGYTNYFNLGSRSYKVISQVQQRSRLTIDQVMQYQIATINGVPIPVSALAHVKAETVPQTITHFQQVNSATISGVPALGVSQAQALQTLRQLAAQTLPSDVLIDYAGPLRQLRAGKQRFCRHLWLGPDHHLPRAGRAVRELPRPAGHPCLHPDVDRRRPGVHQPRVGRRHAEHLHRGRAGHADGPDQQARHPDRRGRQRGPTRRQIETGGDHLRRRHPPPPHPDDDGGDGAGRRAADHRVRRWRGVAVQHGAGHCQRLVDRNGVYPVRAAGGLSAYRRPPRGGGDTASERVASSAFLNPRITPERVAWPYPCLPLS